MAAMVKLGLRVLQFLWTLLVLALTGNMIAEAFAGNPSAVNFTIFVAVFAMLSLLYLIPASVKESLTIHPIIMLALDVINTLLFLIAGIVMAAKLGVHSCGNEDYLKSNSITNGSGNMGKRCHQAQAVTAFLWFGFAAFLASTVLSALGSRGGSSTRGSPLRRGGPAMSTV
ncbi:MAG: hypothetical protein M1815_005155 [Lichina confinis]|nr:MAG: hypothetical protein M1815_005155 [Lichina confinis]